MAGEAINYRRFFDINGLIGLRVEDPAVFGATHRLIVGWVEEGPVAGSGGKPRARRCRSQWQGAAFFTIRASGGGSAWHLRSNP